MYRFCSSVYLFAILLVCTLSISGAEIQKVEGEIFSVTAFPNRALVQRKYVVPTGNIKSGAVRFIRLPVSILPETLRVSGEGLSVSGVAKTVNPDDSERIQSPVEKQIEKLEREVRAQNDLLTNYREQLKLVDSFARLSSERSDREASIGVFSVKNWQMALDFTEQKRSDYQKKIYLAEEKRNDLNASIQRLRATASRTRNNDRYSPIEVDVTYNRGASAGAVILEYQVRNVSWTGVYDIQGNSESNDFTLVSHAAIRQNTGEDWTNVKLTLSTALPAAGSTPGTLTPWRVSASSFFSNMAKTRGQMADAAAPMLEESELRDEGSAPLVEPENQTETSTQTFELVTRETIRSDQSEHKVTLAQDQLNAKVSHLAIPALSTSVYLKAKMKNTTGRSLPAGKLSIYLDGNFTGESTMPGLIASKEEFELYLGVDQRMQVKRNLKRGNIESTGVFTKKVNVVNEWEFEVNNFTSKVKHLTVMDQFPVTMDPNIVTRFLGSSRKDVAQDQNGILTWTIDLNPGQNLKFDFAYELIVDKEIWDRIIASSPVRYQKNAAPNAAQEAMQYNLDDMLQRKR